MVGPRITRRQLLSALPLTFLGGCNSVVGSLAGDPPAWPTIQHDPGHTGHLPDESVPEQGLVSKWDVETDHDELCLQKPAVTDDALFTGTPDALVGVNTDDGTVRWRRSGVGDGERRVGDVHAGRDRVFAVWDAGRGVSDKLAAHDPSTGKVAWELTTNTTLGAALPVGDRLFAVATFSVGQRLLEFDPRTGDRRGSAPVSLASTPPLAFADGTLFSGTYRDTDGFLGRWTLCALDPATGEREWSRDVDGYGVGGRYSAGSPHLTVADGRVYFGTGPATLYALDAADGSVEWTYQPEEGATATGHAPVVDGSRVYFVNLSRVVALDAATGDEAWVYDEMDLEIRGHPERYPILAGGTLLVPGRVDLVALDAETGEERYRWGYATDGLAGIAPVLVDDVLYAAFGDSRYAIPESW